MKKKFKISFNAPITLGFVAICFVVTLLGIITSGGSTRLLFMTYHSSLVNPLTYLRFFTHVFGHAGWSHFIGNASYLLLLGPMLEEKHGSKELLEVIVITAFVPALINYIFFPHIGLLGASGVVFAFILLASFTGFEEGEIPLTFILVTVIFIGQQVYEGIAYKDNISHMGHIVGGMLGAVSGYMLNKKSRLGA
ncbi:MAG: rhomboid family intramembrane serine protease [Lachnospiraceae bacterium]|nr:rhomboid family intramembrane serine protease [Lachnospiraceae bacterium]